MADCGLTDGKANVKKIEVFGLPNDRVLAQLGKTEPNVWNGEVSVKRYRITVEEIEEPAEVLKERLQALLKRRGHIDDVDAIRAEANRLGITLD